MGCPLELNTKRITEILAMESYGAEYQPIINTVSLEIYGYEALSRFHYQGQSIPPLEIFASVHDENDLYFMLESRMKSFQLEHAPDFTKPLFLNLDPHTCLKEYQVKHWVKTFKDIPHLHIEITENLHQHVMSDLRLFADWLKEYGIAYGLDDVGGADALIPLDILAEADFIKLDRSWFERIEENEAFEMMLLALIGFAKKLGKATVLEGIESKRDLEFARMFGVDYVQGFLFRKQFVRKGGA